MKRYPGYPHGIIVIENTAPPKDEHELTLRLMYACIIPFVSTETKLPPAGAIRLSRELALDFSCAEPPENDDYKFMLQSKTWYFDIPQRTIFVGPAQVRTIFCQPSADSNVVIVILTAPGSNEIGGRIAWRWGGGELSGLSMFDDLDNQALVQQVESLIKLILLYRTTIPDGSIKPLKQIWTGEGRRHITDNEYHKGSLFSVSDLTSPKDRFGRAESSREKYWTLGHRVQIRGHFRWQAFGEGFSRHRLRWIAAHWRGIDDEKPKIEKL